MKVEWRPLAEADLSEIVRYVASENPIAAYDLHRKIVSHATILIEHPLIGRPGRIADTRELVIPRTHYIIAYRLAGETIIVLRVLHSARRWPLSI